MIASSIDSRMCWPLPVPRPRQQRRRDRLRRVVRRQLVRHDRSHQPRPLPIRPGLDRRQPRHPLDQRIIHRLLRIRPGLPKPADRDIDDLRRHRPHRVLAQPHPLRHPRPEVLHEYVGRPGQPQHRLPRPRLLQVQRHRPLVAVIVQKRRREPAPPVIRRPRMVPAIRVLHLDHVRPLIRQDHGRQRTRDHRGQVDNAIAVQRSGHERLLWQRLADDMGAGRRIGANRRT